MSEPEGGGILARPVILLATEGTYPHSLGGVSTWCDALIHHLPEADFIVFAVAMNAYVSQLFPVYPNLREIVTVPLWGTQDPSEHRTDKPFSSIFLQKQRTTDSEVERTFLPLFLSLLDQIQSEGCDPAATGQTIAAMYRHFQIFDYRNTFKSPVIWDHYRAWLLQASEAGFWPEPTVYEAVQGLGWIFRFLTVLNTTIPSVDLVHASASAFCGMAGIVSKVLYGTPYLLTEHGVYLREQYLAVSRSNMGAFGKRFLLFLIRTIVRANLHFADEITPVCAFNIRWERVLGADPSKARVIYNGVDPTIFHPSPRRPDEGSGEVGSGPLRILTIARSDPNKDLETLLRAIAIVKAKIPAVQLTVRGAVSVPEYHERILRLRGELGLEETVAFRGHTDEVAPAYREADIVVQASVSEAFPYSVVEAMMSGLPVVATDVGGTREALGDAGISVPSRDPERLAVALILLANDPKLRADLGRRARQRALALFTRERHLEAYRETYLRLAERQALEAPRTRARGEAVGARSVARQKLALDRVFALRAAGLTREARQFLSEAISADPDHPASAALLAILASLDRSLGNEAQSSETLLRAWILNRVMSA